MSKLELIASLKWKIEKWRKLHEENPNDTYLKLIQTAEKELRKLHARQN